MAKVSASRTILPVDTGLHSCPHCDADLWSPLACEECGALLESTDKGTPFVIFGLERAWDIDRKDLRRRLLRLQRLVHPDHAGDTDQAQEAAATLNHAHEVLADPSLRANLLLRLLGGPDESAERKMPQDFLMEVLEWNETLDEITEDEGSEPASREARLIPLQDELLQRREDLLVEVGAALMPLPEPKSESLALLRRRLNAARYLARTLWRIREMRLTEQGLSGATKPPL